MTTFLADILPPPKEHRQTKIVATVGPATRNEKDLRRLIQNGVNVFRLNFSHGSHEEHSASLHIIRRVSQELKIPVAVLQDLSGPKLRITQGEKDFWELHDGQKITLQHGGEDALSNTEILFCPTIDPTSVLSPGHIVLLADGIITLRAEKVTKQGVVCTVEKGGRIRSRVGIAFPDSEVELPATTEKDHEDLEWGIEHEIDYVAISFVSKAEDIINIRVRALLKDSPLQIVAKIERKNALKNIAEILDAADGVMVARGDLGLEFPVEKIPLIQRELIEEANHRGIPVIVATQMLHSMITSVRPTRAEVADIAAAVMGGADAVMLSEETAIGENPHLAVEYLDRIAREAERHFFFEEYKPRLRDADHETIPDSLAYGAAATAVKVKAAAVIACTETGTTARLLAKYRPQQPLIGATPREDTLRRMCLYWGVLPLFCPSAKTHDEEVEQALRVIEKESRFPDGARAVVIGGLAGGKPGGTSVLEIREINGKKE